MARTGCWQVPLALRFLEPPQQGEEGSNEGLVRSAGRYPGRSYCFLSDVWPISRVSLTRRITGVASGAQVRWKLVRGTAGRASGGIHNDMLARAKPQHDHKAAIAADVVNVAVPLEQRPGAAIGLAFLRVDGASVRFNTMVACSGRPFGIPKSRVHS